MVAICFLGNIDDGFEVNHIDGDKSNNHLSNLEIVTRSENLKHRLRIGLCEYNKPTQKYSDEDVLNVIKMHDEGFSQIEISKELDIHVTSVSSFLNGRSRSDITGISSN